MFVDVGARTGVDAGTWLGVGGGARTGVDDGTWLGVGVGALLDVFFEGVGVGALLGVFFEGVGAGESTLNINILKKVSKMLSRIALIHT